MPLTPTRLRRSFLADPDAAAAARRELAAFVAAHGGSAALRSVVELAVGEALNNVVMHAYRDREAPGPARLEAVVQDEELVVTIRDEGMGIVPREDSPGCGFGLGLMARLAEQVCLGDLEPGAEVRLHFAWATA